MAVTGLRVTGRTQEVQGPLGVEEVVMGSVVGAEGEPELQRLLKHPVKQPRPQQSRCNQGHSVLAVVQDVVICS